MVARHSLLVFISFLCQAVPCVLAHDHGGVDGPTDMGQSRAFLSQTVAASPTATESSPTSTPNNYLSYPEHGGLMLGHIVLMTSGWFFVLPIAVVLSIAGSRLALPVQLSFLGFHSIATILGTIYKNNTPQLYKSNAHGPVGWIATLMVVIQCVLGFMNLAAGWKQSKNDEQEEQEALLPMTLQALELHEQEQRSASPHPYRFSGDSGHFTASEPSRSQSVSSTTTYTREDQQKLNEYEADYRYSEQNSEKTEPLGAEKLEYLVLSVGGILSKRALRAANRATNFIDRTILMIGFVAFVTGAVVYGGVFHGHNVFNGLAHTIKGGIFFWYGLLTLGRWMGCFAEYGWAWNVKPPASVVGKWKARIPSAEFVESFIIFLYGASNVFLEHLAAWGKAWSPMDLEHISITIMFFGGGLCGMLVESGRIRDLLNSIMLTSDAAHGPQQIRENLRPPKSYPVSLNPMPALVIMLLGLMMSSHHQHSMISTMIHMQWGTLFVGFALSRGVTYILTYISPPTSYLPSRPPSELISSFCLVSGGIIFMVSNRDTVNSLEAHEIHAMFPFTVTMGFTSFLMAWTIIVLAVKGWAVRRNPPSSNRNFHKLDRA